MYGQDQQPLTTCPHCHAKNPARTIFCQSCGINIASYTQVADQIADLRTQRLAEAHNADAVAQEQLLGAQKQKLQQALRGRSRVLGAVAGLLILAIGLFIVASIIIDYRQQQRLEAYYAGGLACYESSDYRCAINNFKAANHIQQDYRDIQTLLQSSQFALAEQHYNAGNDESALNLLFDILEKNEDHLQAIEFANNIYDERIQSAVRRLDLFKAAALELERQRRLP